MIREVEVNNTKIRYDLQYKKVKNINLRIKADGSICVSANKRVPRSVIDDFIISKSDYIFRAISKMQEKAELPKTQYYTESEVKELIIKLCKKVYPYYEEKGIKYPQIKFRKMVSQWGNCYPKKSILTFNTNLMYADGECIEYVVYHEFTHFLQANHSSKFYNELEKVCPNWKQRRNKLKEVNIRNE